MSLRSIGDRVSWWVRRRRISGVSAVELLTRELPGKIVGKAANAVRQRVNGVLTPVHDATYAKRIAQAFSDVDCAPLVLVAVPGILHYTIPCLSLVAGRVPVVVVANGIRDWEQAVLREVFRGLPVVHLNPVGGSMLPHGVVIDLLLRHTERRFTLLDPDLFVFDTEALEQLDCGENEIAVGAYGFVNPATSREFPTTHLLSLDVPAVRDLMRRHRIRPIIYYRTPPHLSEMLAAAGFGDHNFVKEYLGYYDPMNLLFAVALAEGKRFRVLHLEDETATHVGGVSYLERSATLDYFNLRLLELPFASSFRRRYRAMLAPGLTVETARERLEGVSQDTVDWAERTVGRVAERIS